MTVAGPRVVVEGEGVKARDTLHCTLFQLEQLCNMTVLSVLAVFVLSSENGTNKKIFRLLSLQSDFVW